MGGYFPLGAADSSSNSAVSIYQQKEQPSHDGLWIKTDSDKPKKIRIGKKSDTSVLTADTVLPNKCAISGCTIGNKVYLVGGYYRPPGVYDYTYYKNILVYDMTTDIITTLIENNSNIHDKEYCVSVGNLIYLVDSRKIFDTETSIFTSISGFSSVSSSYSSYHKNCCSLNNQIFRVYSSNEYSASIYIYDTETQIETHQSIKGNSNPTIYAIGDKLYLFGGFYDYVDDRIVRCTTHSTIQMFDISTKILTTSKAKLSNGLYDIGVSHRKNKIYLFGGTSVKYSNPKTTYTQYDLVHIYDTETDSIELDNISLPLTIGNSAVCPDGDGGFYIFGGVSGENTGLNLIYLNSILFYDFGYKSYINSDEIFVNLSKDISSGTPTGLANNIYVNIDTVVEKNDNIVRFVDAVSIDNGICTNIN